MNLEIPNLLSSGYTEVKEMTMNDFRSISFMIENDSDKSFYDFIKSKIRTDSNGVDMLVSLLEARSKYVDNILTLNNGTSNVSIDIDNWIKSLRNNVKPIRKVLQYEALSIVVDYPEDIYFSSYDDVLESTIKSMELNGNTIEFSPLPKEEKKDILDKTPMGAIKLINDYISESGENIILFEERLGLPELHVNFFNNSAYSLLKTIYSYYKPEYIVELLFSMSKRINDISYLNSVTPREFSLIIKLYEEEIEKLNQSTN